MKTLTTFILVLLVAFGAQASNRITATVTVTNATVNGLTFTVNGNVRTFTNQVFQTGSQVLTNADATGCGSKTNLFSQIALSPFAQVTPFDTGSNTFQLQGTCGGALVVSASGTYVSVSYSTQTCATATPVGVSFDSYYPSAPKRSVVASQLITDLNTYGDQPFSQVATLGTEFLGTTNAQTVAGAKAFTNSSSSFNGTVTNSPSISGDVSWLRNGVISNATMIWGTSGTNAMITSAGLAQFNIALAIQVFGGTKFDFGDVGLNGDLQFYAQTNGSSTPIVIYNANPTNMSFVVPVSFSSSNSIGTDLTVNRNTAIAGSATVGTNLTVTGNATIGGGLTVIGLNTNAAFTGTNNFPAGADIAFGRASVSSLANGNNAAVPVGTNEFIEVSGPSGSFAINGIANGRDGKIISILNQTGFQMTIANESGSDPTAANRIRTLGSATDLVFTNAMVNLQYSGAASRWVVRSHNP